MDPEILCPPPSRVKPLMDRTQWDAVYALLEAVKVAADAGDENPCTRLAHAAQMVMTALPVEDE